MKLDQLSQIADRALAGLEAGPELRLRIQMEAIRREKRRKTFVAAGRVAAVACCAVLLFAILLFPQDRGGEISVPHITSLPMGDVSASPEEERSEAIRGEASISGTRQRGDSGIWAETGDGTFPLIGLKGTYYRQMTVAVSLSGDQLTEVGKVDEYTTEPSLSDLSIISSNCVNAGGTVYTVRGMESTFLVAETGGERRLFQRISFNGKALARNETLASSLQVSGHILSMSLTGRGTVRGEAAEKLFAGLLQDASFESSGSLTTDTVLTISLDNGLSAQMMVRDDRLSACGIWSCPEFFDAFDLAAE